jgi:uncharacterized protein (DUF1015 family)
MTKIIPFKALRPVRDKVHLVATRPYYSYKENVLSAKLEDNPYTFLRIINPEFDKTVKKTKPNSIERFNLVKEKYAEFIGKGILIQDREPHIYIYRQSKDDRAFTGVIAGASIQEYEENKIKKHEATLSSREAMFTQYLDVVGYNAEPVLLSYPHHSELELLLEEMTTERPEYEFTTTDTVKHELWVIDEFNGSKIQELFLQIDATYIADGHHRSASSAGLNKERRAKGQFDYENQHYFLAFFMDEEKLKILEFNRLVQGLNGLSKDEFLKKISAFFNIAQCSALNKPKEEHEITMCLEGEWYALQCHDSIIEHKHPVKSLDSEILTQYILKPILGIQDLKTDQRIEFISGAEPLTNFEQKIIEGNFSVGFVLFPATMAQVKQVADNNMIMPPKSTWVEPKLRSGLTIYHINE